VVGQPDGRGALHARHGRGRTRLVHAALRCALGGRAVASGRRASAVVRAVVVVRLESEVRQTDSSLAPSQDARRRVRMFLLHRRLRRALPERVSAVEGVGRVVRDDERVLGPALRPRHRQSRLRTFSPHDDTRSDGRRCQERDRASCSLGALGSPRCLFPLLPYHSLPAAHVRLLKALPADHVYRTTNSPSFVSALNRALAHRRREARQEAR